jgi:VanZ family protein
MVSSGNKWHYAPALICALMILAGTSIPYFSPPSIGITWQDKLEHFTAYAMFGAAITYGNIRSGKRRQLLMAVILCSVFGVLDEIHQHWIPGRSTDVYDWVADTLGALTGAAIIMLSQKHWLPWFGNKTRTAK